jgi:hypothetical protein
MFVSAFFGLKHGSPVNKDLFRVIWNCVRELKKYFLYLKSRAEQKFLVKNCKRFFFFYIYIYFTLRSCLRMHLRGLSVHLTFKKSV